MHSGHGNTRFQCPIEPNTNLPIALVKLPCKQSSCETRSSANHIPCSACSTCHSSIVSFSVADETNQNITAAQKELLLWHWRLGHLGFVHLQQIMRPRPTLESSGDAYQQNHPIPPCIIPRIDSTKTCKPPLCSSCEIARAKRRSCDSTVHHRLKEYVLKTDHLTPGTMVSVDQYESSVGGRLPDTRGQERFGVKYMGGTIFCDHASGYIQCFHQVSLRATDTVISKQKFERIAKGCGVQILSYHGDNGVFGSNEFRQALIESDQFLNFSGVGAHHQNGVAERAIRTVTEKARAMMQHVSTHWPDGFEISLWPFALHHACWLHNHTPSHSFGFSPIELFCQTKSACHHLQRARTWGSPTYVLDSKLQDGKKIPKWAPKARRGQFLGYSPDHSSSVGLIRNLQTGSISPQFHVVFDELFSTVLGTQDDDPVWIELFHNEQEYYGPDDDEADDLQHFPDLDHGWLPAHEQCLDNTERLFQMPNMQTHTSADQDNSPSFTSQRNQEDTMPFEPSHPIAHNQDQDAQPDNEPPDISTPAELPTVGTSLERRLRTRQPNSKFFGNDWVNSSSSSHQSGHLFQTPLSRTLVGIHQPDRLQEDQIFDNLDWDTRFHGEYTGLQDINDLHTDPATGKVEWQHPFSMGVKASNADTPMLREIHKLSPAESNAWYDSMDVEIAALRAKNTMIEINRSDVPADQQIIKSTWAFRRKRRPNGDIYKLKSRFVVQGGLQILTPTEQTYSPVVDWSTVRLLSILATAQHLHSITIDFTSAFVQSTLPAPIYLELPPGYSVPGEDRVFKVFKSLYGDIRAAKLWYQYLCDALVKKLGFHRSSIDPCLFIRHGLIFAFYVDDGIILSARQADSLAFVQELRQAGFDLGIEADYAGYLGVEIAPQADGTLLLSQSGLIQRILNDLSLTDATTVKATPAHEILSHHANSPLLTNPSSSINLSWENFSISPPTLALTYHLPITSVLASPFIPKFHMALLSNELVAISWVPKTKG
jgi:transposase InsO family protein